MNVVIPAGTLRVGDLLGMSTTGVAWLNGCKFTGTDRKGAIVLRRPLTDSPPFPRPNGG
jgi:hypothetical protein